MRAYETAKLHTADRQHRYVMFSIHQDIDPPVSGSAFIHTETFLPVKVYSTYV